MNKENRTTDAAAECRRTRSNGHGTRRKTKPNFLRSYLLSLAGALFFRIFGWNDSSRCFAVRRTAGLVALALR
ncbi:hypothetical protein, partial [Rikenella microfusus]|uniref:hypothetical protein n=1 Tax=Rikenella microfusus TaxID=28139 RepID=UPI003AB7D7BE